MSAFLHLSDFHLSENDATSLKGMEPTLILKNTISKIVNKINDFGKLDGIIITGDISDDGSKTSYLNANKILKKTDLPILAVPGNHDLRRPMMDHFTTASNFATSQFFDWAYETSDTKVIGLDTLVEGETFGMLREESLNFLRENIQFEIKKNLVLAIHHPPIKTGIPFMDKIGLKNSEELLECLNTAEKPLRILCGHVHGVYHGSLGAHSVVTAPSTCTRFSFNRRSDAPKGFKLFPTGFAYLDSSTDGFWTPLTTSNQV